MTFMSQGKRASESRRLMFVLLYYIGMLINQRESIVDISVEEDKVTLTNFSLLHCFTKFFSKISSASLKN